MRKRSVRKKIGIEDASCTGRKKKKKGRRTTNTELKYRERNGERERYGNKQGDVSGQSLFR